MPPVRGDTDKVTQVLTNLVSNAIKYTPAGGWVKVCWKSPATPSVTTCVADSGIGIAPEDQKKLFQKFFRADNSSTREAGGTGLGLVIAKTIVELLGGAIWVESEVGRAAGSISRCRSRRIGARACAREPAALPDRGIGLVLIVDDDAYVRGLIQHHLHRRGYGTIWGGGRDRCAAEGASAQTRCDHARFYDAGYGRLPRPARAFKQDPATAASR